jgi:hypothetical protein
MPPLATGPNPSKATIKVLAPSESNSSLVAEAAPAAAAEAKRASESASAAAGLLGLSCAISESGEVRLAPRLNMIPTEGIMSLLILF